MGLFSVFKKVRKAKKNPLQFIVDMAIGGGEKEGDPNMLPGICLQTYHAYGCGMVFQALDEYFAYEGDDWTMVYSWLVTCANILILGSPELVQGMKDRKPKFEPYLKHPDPKVSEEADSLVHLLVDEEQLEEAREEGKLHGGVSFDD